MNNLKPCPFCGGKAELDGRQAYRNLSTGAIENQSVVYCTKCTAQISICHPDHRDLSHDDLNYVVIEQWNSRESRELSEANQKINELQHRILEHCQFGSRQQDEIAHLEEALKFYANHIHWMSLAGDSELQTVLIAGKLWDMNGWAVAEKALKKEYPRAAAEGVDHAR
jgi:hypothetical protein